MRKTVLRWLKTVAIVLSPLVLTAAYTNDGSNVTQVPGIFDSTGAPHTLNSDTNGNLIVVGAGAGTGGAFTVGTYNTTTPTVTSGNNAPVTLGPNGQATTLNTLDMAPAAGGAAAVASLSANTSTSVISSLTDNESFALFCTTDSFWRITHGASTASTTTDQPIPAKTWWFAYNGYKQCAATTTCDTITAISTVAGTCTCILLQPLP